MNGTHFGKARKQAAFLNIGCGGIGRLATLERRKREHALGLTIPEQTLLIDTAPFEDASEFDCQIGLNQSIVDLISGSASQFGTRTDEILRALRKHKRLEADQIRDGARTIRCMTQLAMLYHRVNVLKKVKSAVTWLMKNHAPKTIVPVIYSSSGGGSGSALQVLLALLLTAELSKRYILLGMPNDILERPLLMVVEPFFYAHRAAADHRDAILANAFAFRSESEQLLQDSRVQSVFHIGYSNAEAIVLDEPSIAARVLAETLVEFQRGYSSYKERWVDSRAFAATRRTQLDNSPTSIQDIEFLVRSQGENHDRF